MDMTCNSYPLRTGGASAANALSQCAPFAQQGGLGKVHRLFGDNLSELLASLNDALAA